MDLGFCGFRSFCVCFYDVDTLQLVDLPCSSLGSRCDCVAAKELKVCYHAGCRASPLLTGGTGICWGRWGSGEPQGVG